MENVRACDGRDFDAIHAIINAAAVAYRGAIPDEHWHEPYMSYDLLEREIESGIQFYGVDRLDRLVGVMGLHPKGAVDIIRHAYILPNFQGRGLGARLLDHLRSISGKPILIGTWKAATWAVRFYERHGFRVLDPAIARPLLTTYWDVPESQMNVSVVLADRHMCVSAA